MNLAEFVSDYVNTVDAHDGAGEIAIAYADATVESVEEFEAMMRDGRIDDLRSQVEYYLA